MNLGEIRGEIYDDLGFTATPTATIVTRIDRWINEANRKILREPTLDMLRFATLSFTSIASQPLYGIPSAFERLDYLVQQSNDFYLTMKTREWYREIDPGERSIGTPRHWIPEGDQPVMRHPVSSGMWAVSTSASDTGIDVVLQGVRANGDVQAAITTTLTGLTRKAIGTATDWVRIVRWNLSAAAVGDVELYDAASGGNLMGRIQIGKTAVRYLGIRLWPTPSAALVYVADGQLKPQTMDSANQVPRCPESFHDLLVTWPRHRFYKRQGDHDRAAAEYASFDEEKNRLLSEIQFPASYRPRSGFIGDARRWNNLGGWFPADAGLL
jgi:hypothetical protein